MGNRLEVVDNRKAVYTKLFLDQGRADYPGVVGKADDFTADRTRYGHGNTRGEGSAHTIPEIFPRSLKTGVILRVDRPRLA